MAFPTIFNNLPTGNVAASTLDTMFNVVGGMAIINCTATGTNTIALTPATNMPTFAAYNTLSVNQTFGFLAAANTTGSATVNIAGIGALNLYKSDGTTQVGNGDLISAAYYQIIYNANLNSSAGGFQLVSPSGAVGYPGLPCVAAGGSSDAITATYSPAVALADLTLVAFTATAANSTTTPTFAPNGLTAHTITKKGGQALATNDIPGALAVMMVEYNAANTRWELLNPAAGAAASGALTLLNTVNASGAASVTFSSTYITNAYNKYIIEYDNLLGSTGGGDVILTVSTDNGSTYKNSNYSSTGYSQPLNAGTLTSAGATGQSNIQLSAGAVLATTAATAGAGTIKFSNPSAGTGNTVFFSDILESTASGGTMSKFAGAYVGAVTAINNIKIASSAGGTLTGNFHLYGVSGT